MTDPRHKVDEGIRAFPNDGAWANNNPEGGMSLRDYLAGQALSNSAICTGEADGWQLNAWFGKEATGITRGQIVGAQAYEYADAMINRRARR